MSSHGNAAVQPLTEGSANKVIVQIELADGCSQRQQVLEGGGINDDDMLPGTTAPSLLQTPKADSRH